MPRTRATAEVELRIIELRADRQSFRAIAVELGLSHQRVHQLWTRALDRLPAQRLDEHRTEETELADTATRELLEIARDSRSSARTKIEAWSVLRSWAERKAKLLGLDAPTRTQVDVVQILEEQTEVVREAMALAMNALEMTPEVQRALMSQMSAAFRELEASENDS